MNLTKLIKDNYCYFDSLRQGFAYYNLHDGRVMMPDLEEEYHGKREEEVPDYIWDRFGKTNKYQFTIPLDDIGNGTLNTRMKAIELMRWIRQAYEKGELIKVK